MTLNRATEIIKIARVKEDLVDYARLKEAAYRVYKQLHALQEANLSVMQELDELRAAMVRPQRALGYALGPLDETARDVVESR